MVATKRWQVSSCRYRLVSTSSEHRATMVVFYTRLMQLSAFYLCFSVHIFLYSYTIPPTTQRNSFVGFVQLCWVYLVSVNAKDVVDGFFFFIFIIIKIHFCIGLLECGWKYRDFWETHELTVSYTKSTDVQFIVSVPLFHWIVYVKQFTSARFKAYQLFADGISGQVRFFSMSFFSLLPFRHTQLHSDQSAPVSPSVLMPTTQRNAVWILRICLT